MKALKITLQTSAYKNEMRVDVSDMQAEEIISLAAEIAKSMLDDDTKMPKGDADDD